MWRKYGVRIKQSTWAEEMMDIVLWSDLWKPFLYLILKNTKTFVQPVGQPVEDDSVHPRGGDSQRVTPHVGLVVDVVLKDVDLKRKRRWWRWWFPLWWHFIFWIKATGFISSRSDACVYPPASISVWIFAFSPLFFYFQLCSEYPWVTQQLHLQHLSSVNMLHTKRHHEANEIFIICASCVRTPALYFNVWIDYSVRNGRKKMLRPK